MSSFPCLARFVSGSGQVRFRLGDRLVDRYLEFVAGRCRPNTHTLALLRYGVLGHGGAGLHDIWGMSNTTAEAALSLLVLVGWAMLITAASIRVFNRSAVN